MFLTGLEVSLTIGKEGPIRDRNVNLDPRGEDWRLVRKPRQKGANVSFR